MKRCVVIIFILCIALFSLCADKNIWVPNSLNIGMGNDMWNIGVLSFNADDQLSFSNHIYLSSPFWSLKLNMMAISNRGWQNGWQVDNSDVLGDGNTYSGRYDLTEISFSLNFNLFDSNKLFLSLTPDLGIAIAGKQGYADIQNSFHKILQIPTLDIEYDYPYNDVRLLLNSNIEGGYKIFNNTYIGLGSKIQYIHNFSTINTLYLAIGNSENFTLSFEYVFAKSESNWKTQDIYFDYLNGPSLSVSIDSGLMKIFFYANLHSSNGYGIVSFDLLSIFQKTTWKENDMLLSFNRYSQINSNFYEAKYLIPIKESNYMIFASIRYLSDNQSFIEREQKQDLRYYERYRKAFSSFLLGGSYDFIIQSIPFIPYVNLSAGAMLWQVIIQRNMMENNDTKSIVYPLICSFAIDFEIGIKLFPNGGIKTQNTETQFLIFSGFTIINNPKEVKGYLENKTDNSSSINYILPRFGCGIQIGFDV